MEKLKRFLKPQAALEKLKRFLIPKTALAKLKRFLTPQTALAKRLRLALAIVVVLAGAFILGYIVSPTSQSDETNPQLSSASPSPTTQSDLTEPSPTSSSTSPPTSTPTSEPTTRPTPTPEPAPEPIPEVVFIVLDEEPPTAEQAIEMASNLAPDFVLPSNCLLPLTNPARLPNAPREYRSGTHQGLDFACNTRGQPALAAFDGRVVLAVRHDHDPSTNDRNALLGIAGDLQATPPHTLEMLYGNYVVLDHGVIPNVGHVVTIYTHLESVDPDIRLGQTIEAGQKLGEIGNRGTSLAALGNYDSELHLHWELHVDNLYLSAGLSPSQTIEVYTVLFQEALQQDDTDEQQSSSNQPENTPEPEPGPSSPDDEPLIAPFPN